MMDPNLISRTGPTVGNDDEGEIERRGRGDYQTSEGGQWEERLRRAHLTEETVDLSHSEDQAGGGDESMLGDPHTPTPAPRPRPSVSFNLDEQDDVNYEKYASPTGPRYVKPKVDPYSRTRTDPYPLDHEEDTSIMMERSKPIATPFPKFNPRDVEIFILEAEAWFKFNQVYEQSRMINHMGAQCQRSRA
ncbi:related to retrotransposon protein [Ustilago sp. UG-2017b]|nr:related to retrotransposon protein [Ustilago sp. UG-2017b]